MKAAAALLCIIPAMTMAQRRGPVVNMHYAVSAANHQQLYHRALGQVQQNIIDSFYSASRTLQALFCYDSIVYSRKVVVPLLSRIKESNLDNAHKLLTGRWHFRWSGSNWGTAKTYEDETRYVVFDGANAVFYTGDTITRITPYTFVPYRQAAAGGLPEAVIFNIRFTDTKQELRFWFYTGDKYLFYVGKIETPQLRLMEPYCGCGCGEEVYVKLKEPLSAVQ